MPLIPLIKPDIAFDEVADDIRQVLESGCLTQGPFVARLEALVAARVGVSHAFATTSATTALHLALVARGIGPGDEVLASDFTFPATGNVIVEAGADPVLVDCRDGGFDLDVEHAASLVTARTRAIIAVDPFGQPCDMAAVQALAARHGLAVIEDAACAIGGHRDGQSCGGWPGAAGCFSFHPRKVVTTGEGGMITTDDDALAERIAVLRTHGGVRGAIAMSFVANGFNYRLSEIQAVLGIRQMERLDLIIDDRRRTAVRYMALLDGMDGVSVPLAAPVEDCTFQSFVVWLDPAINRDQVIGIMRGHGIEVTIGTYAMHAEPAFARFGYAPGQLPRSWQACLRTLTLPLLPHMPETTVEMIAGHLSRAVAMARLK